MVTLSRNAYGKSDVRLTRVSRHGERHDLKELSVSIQLEGAFERSYTEGDNSPIVATDTMKNTVYALAKDHPLDSIEAFAKTLATHFVNENDHVTSAIVAIEESAWDRIVVDGKPHDHSFVGGGAEKRTALVVQSRTSTSVASGLKDLLVLKTTRSGFEGFIRDRYTTLKETNDRIFATAVAADWTYDTPDLDFNACYDAVRTAMLKVFAEHDSLAVQQTLYAMGEAALEVCPEMGAITLTMPNKHRLLVNLEPFGLSNPNEIFVWTDEPYGLISGTISRDG